MKCSHLVLSQLVCMCSKRGFHTDFHFVSLASMQKWIKHTNSFKGKIEKKKMKSFVSVSRVVFFSLYISIRIGIRIFLFQLLFIRTKIGQRARKNVFIKNLPNQFKIFRPQIYHTGVCASIFALIQLCY